MSFLRFVARSMLASYFVASGVRTLRNPEDLSDATRPLADGVLPKVTAALPSGVRPFLPSEPTGIARCIGAAQIVGGLSLATGLGRRGGAAVLAVSLLPSLVSTKPKELDAAARTRVGTDIALLGGAVLAALDTQGEPDLRWRIRAARKVALQQKQKQTSKTPADHKKARRGCARRRAAEASAGVRS